MIDREALRTVLAEALREVLPELLPAVLRTMAAATDDQLLTPAAWAAARGVSVQTVRRAVREGRLLCERVGRSVRIPRTATMAATRAATAGDDAARLARLRQPIRVVR